MECPICFEELESKSVVKLSCCKKEIHLECCAKMPAPRRCPLCRADLPDLDVEQHPQYIIVRERPYVGFLGLIPLAVVGFFLLYQFK